MQVTTVKPLSGRSTVLFVSACVLILASIAPWVVAILGGHDAEADGIGGWPDAAILFGPVIAFVAALAMLRALRPVYMTSILTVIVLSGCYTCLAVAYVAMGPSSALEFSSNVTQVLQALLLMFMIVLPFSAIVAAAALLLRQRVQQT
ncbi:hypothetical protein P5P86_18180 [Nocardioides sp. BP30]|uniref:hypothetical protein n=1 Tax=Nocardioides sp. BP30 TaxID=3036374 RepID=UPI0024692CBA|nr:hypothetical protein [Nocardioides sp. BP30]WGL51870.1 hypothetical protein P5P86_18180 [Nocardioides sp. BP30]